GSGQPPRSQVTGKRPPRLRAGFILSSLVLALPMVSCAQEPRAGSPPASLLDPRLAELRRSSSSWEDRPARRRRALDVVCSVPDLPTFLAAISTWDEDHYFPILLDDPAWTLKFLRSFRPARVVQLTRRGEPIPPGQLWSQSVAAVGRSWTASGAD